ncbi:unnamed protein product [Wuchereria bancrofti]|uniref:Uncharacterized protein n=1 Tax=Wuchereria bancrofti TaxID=6293 RepID=A0A3P7EKX6_WUCBA|nr:unnamed protein product [Wuchereria bancrofti]
MPELGNVGHMMGSPHCNFQMIMAVVCNLLVMFGIIFNANNTIIISFFKIKLKHGHFQQGL